MVCYSCVWLALHVAHDILLLTIIHHLTDCLQSMARHITGSGIMPISSSSVLSSSSSSSVIAVLTRTLGAIRDTAARFIRTHQWSDADGVIVYYHDT